MNLEVTNAYVVQLKNGNFFVEKKNVYVQNGNIYFTKPFDLADRVIDAEEKVLLPSFVNAHHHIYSCLSKGIPAEIPFKDFQGTLSKLWWKLDRSLTEDDMILSTALTMEDCIKNGVTTVFDHHISLGYIENSLSGMAQVFDDYKVSGALAFEISDRNGKEMFERTLAENVRFTKENQEKNVKGMIGLHASFTLTQPSMEKIAADSGNFPIHVHVAEGDVDEIECQKQFGKTILERLNDLQLLRENSLLVHGSNLQEIELDLLKSQPVFLAQAVDSNMNNALQVANIHDIIKKGVSVTIGTDGMTSNILKTMKNSYLVAKYINKNPDIGFPEMNHLLLQNYKLKEQFGFPLGLEENKPADFVLMDYQPATPFDSDTFLGHFIFGITEARPQYVIKNGSILMDDFKIKANSKYEDYKSRSLEISKKLFIRFQE